MAGGIVWSEVFPTKTTLFIFISYISLFVCQGIFVTASQDKSNKYEYNTVCVVLITELVKLVVSVLLYWKSHSLTDFAKETFANKKMLLLYFIPSFFYCVYNNLTFGNLSTFDPTTYYLLLQFRVVITGLLFQLIFSRILSRRQWFSLILLTAGCMVKQINFDTILSQLGIGDAASNSTAATSTSAVTSGSTKNTAGFELSIDAIFIIVQLTCSCLAGVYNEYLLKGDGARVNIFIQNLFMYVDSIVCNVIFLAIQGNILDAFTIDNLRPVFTFNVIIIIINNAAIGITTSFFLRYLNSILKTFASALELCFTAILCYFLFKIPVYLNTIFSIGIVSLAIYLYTLSPVVNPAKKSTTYECKPTPEIAIVHIDTEVKETKEAKEEKETKESKESIESKEAKEAKESNGTYKSISENV